MEDTPNRPAYINPQGPVPLECGDYLYDPDLKVIYGKYCRPMIFWRPDAAPWRVVAFHAEGNSNARLTQIASVEYKRRRMS